MAVATVTEVVVASVVAALIVKVVVVAAAGAAAELAVAVVLLKASIAVLMAASLCSERINPAPPSLARARAYLSFVLLRRVVRSLGV